MLQIYNRIIPSRSEESLFWLTLLIIILFILMSSLDAIRSIVLIYAAKECHQNLSRQAFELQLRLNSKNGYEKTTAPDNLADVENITNFLSAGYIAYFLDTLWFPMFVIGLYFLHPLFSVLAILGAIWLGLLAIGIHLSVSFTAAEERYRDKGRFANADEIKANVETVVSLGMISNAVKRWQSGYLKSFDQQFSVKERLALIAAAGRASRLLIQSLTLGLGAYLAINDSVSAGAIVASSILVGRALMPIEAAITGLNKLTSANRSYKRLVALVTSDHFGDSRLPVGQVNDGLSVDRLTLIDEQKVVFRDLSFDAAPGTMITIVGSSGAGKSALAKHLVGLRRGSEGVVRLNGMDVCSMNDSTRLLHLGYMPDTATELTGTIVDHIGRFGAFSPEEILLASSMTDANRMILSLPDGYGTRLGRDGYYLSASQRQVLNLTRACCGRPSLIVLDDPSANLDDAGEQSLHRTIDELRLEGCIFCVVTNKTALIRKSDLIVVLNARGESRVGDPRNILRPQIRAVSFNRSESV